MTDLTRRSFLAGVAGLGAALPLSRLAGALPEGNDAPAETVAVTDHNQYSDDPSVARMDGACVITDGKTGGIRLERAQNLLTQALATVVNLQDSHMLLPRQAGMHVVKTHASRDAGYTIPMALFLNQAAEDIGYGLADTRRYCSRWCVVDPEESTEPEFVPGHDDMMRALREPVPVAQVLQWIATTSGVPAPRLVVEAMQEIEPEHLYAVMRAEDAA